MHDEHDNLNVEPDAIASPECESRKAHGLSRVAFLHFVLTNILCTGAIGTGQHVVWGWIAALFMTPLGWVGVLLIRLTDRSLPVNLLTSLIGICLWLGLLWLNSLLWAWVYRRVAMLRSGRSV